MIGELKSVGWKRFKGESQWIRCFAHILNLIIKAILQPFGRKKSNNRGDHESDDSNNEEEAQDLIERFHDVVILQPSNNQ
ncbi:hypothetical protein PSTG_17499 [Puccinia striiformis f. sp. tritici PST-78]|uniref:Uncharacterized protein n=2 Tax=Puccinia striiformis f. sp. tritici TaxID=168172 RepID=A0A0L0UQL5_9BASI|nr:hypothetical protein PSTG_17499 [Puccinia striiformis f. sp. tritici PST-78]